MGDHQQPAGAGRPSAAQVSGQSITEAIKPANWFVALTQVADAKAISAMIALVVGGAALIAPRTWMWQP
ncbi:MAG: hypothetical protein ACFNKK_07365, partial [Peptidiphaga sp.]